MYGKIFDSIYDGTLRADWKALVTFQQFIVLKDQDGTVDMTVHAIHGRTGIPIDIIDAGIEKLLQVDDYSLRKASGADSVEIRRDGSRVRVKFIFPPEVRLPSAEWARIRSEIFIRDDFTCRYCGQRGGYLECDHVTPISRGGCNDDSNLATACFTCNRSKRDKTLLEWRQ